MKLLLATILLFAATLFPQETRNISIQKNNQSGFDIIRNGELIYEYTSKNTDSLTLSTLDYIYFEATKDSSLSTGINVINIPPEDKTNWVPFALAAIAIIGSLGAGYYGNKWSSITQLNHYNRQVRAENKRAWLERVRIEGTRIISLISSVLSAVETLERDLNSEIKLTPDEFQRYLKRAEYKPQLIIQTQRFKFLLNQKKHEVLLTLFDNVLSSIVKTPRQDATERIQLLWSELHTLINDEQEKLDKGKF